MINFSNLRRYGIDLSWSQFFHHILRVGTLLESTTPKFNDIPALLLIEVCVSDPHWIQSVNVYPRAIGVVHLLALVVFRSFSADFVHWLRIVLIECVPLVLERGQSFEFLVTIVDNLDIPGLYLQYVRSRLLVSLSLLLFFDSYTNLRLNLHVRFLPHILVVSWDLEVPTVYAVEGRLLDLRCETFLVIVCI